MGVAVASAPGKVILFGEHFVVKGKRSLVAAIGLRVRAHLRPSGQGIRVRSPALGMDSWIDPASLEPGDPRLAPLARLLRFLRDEYGYSIVGHEAVIESMLPVGAGLGSSASTAVAYALAYTALHGDPLEGERLIRASYEAEREAHGNPSGVDNTIAVVGGGLVYSRTGGFRRVVIRVPRGHSFLIIDTGVPRRTRDVVERVLARAEATWPAARHVYEAADAIIDLALEAFERGDAGLLGELMDLNQGLLSAVGASSLVIEEAVHTARRHGALGAKLTGAGWGGAVIALVPKERVPGVVGALEERGYRVYRVDLGVEGARLEEA